MKIKTNSFAALLSVCCLFLISCSADDNRTAEDLPILGGETVVFSADSSQVDTVQHFIPSFEFTNQHNVLFKSTELDGKIKVVNFFFTSCPSICPLMSRQMNRLRKMTNVGDVTLVSFTVDPKRDTPQKLLEYTENNNFDTRNWVFLTGEADLIYDLGWHGFKLAMAENIDSPGGFVHSEKFVLVDRNNHIRGFYDGTNAQEVLQLARDIKLLL